MKRKVMKYSRRAGWLLSILTMTLLVALSCEQTTGPGDEEPTVTQKLMIYSDRETISANKGSANILVKVYSDDDTTDVVSGVRVTITSDKQTSIQMINTTTDNNGYVRAVLLAGTETGTARVTGSIDSFANATFVNVVSDSVTVTGDLYLNLSSSPSTLSANGSDISSVQAQLFDGDNNPIPGETVYFTTTLGIIQDSGVTDEWGIAKADLRSARVNGIAEVRARYGQIVKSTMVEFTGSGMEVLAVPTVLVADGQGSAEITVNLTDASGAPIVEEQVHLFTDLGTLRTEDGDTSGQAIVDETSTQGRVKAFLSSTDDGEATVKIAALGIVDSLTVQFTNYTFSVAATDQEIFAGGQTTQIVASLRDNDGTIEPIDIDDISFSSTLGTISPVGVADDGSIVAELVSGSSAGTATVTAQLSQPPVSASTAVTFAAATVASVQIQSDKLSVRIGTGEAAIRATVYDETGNPKANETVTFSILKSPGGGEGLTPGTAVTNNKGQAVVTFKAGTQGSSLDGVEILARVGNIQSNVIKLTIAGEPSSVVVGFSSGSFTANQDGTYGVGVSAIVSDVNRNKVADGTLVSFSLRGEVGVIDDQVPTSGGVATATLIYSPSDAGKEVDVTASSGGIYGTKTIILPGEADKIAALEVTPLESTILGDGVATTNFNVYLTGASGEPLSNRTVYATSDMGEVEPSVITGDPSNPDSAPGKANITFRSMATGEDKIATVTINAGGIEKTVKINMKGITLEVTAEPDILPSDGQSKSTINVLVKETTSHIPITSADVYFGASDGYIEGKAMTDNSGVATTTYTAGFNPGTANIMVSFGNSLVETVDVQIYEVTAQGIELFASPAQIAANGISETTITALLRDDNYNPVVGETIRFTTTMGTITASDSTDANGRAEAVLVSERRNGEAIVTAKFKEHVRTVPVIFSGVNINVSASPENVFAGGEDKTIVSAIVKDAAEVPIVGTDVQFDWYLDDMFKETLNAQTDVQGKASIVLSSSEAGQAKIVINGAGAVDSSYVTFTRLQFTIEGERETLSTGGESISVWAQLLDTVSGDYIKNANVEFFTTLGTIQQYSTTDDDGIAYSVLESGQTAGVVTVSASTNYGDHRVSAEKKFTFVNAPADSVNLRIDANIVAVNGGNSELIAVVTDSFGNPVPEALVSFKIIQGPAGGEYINPAIVTTGQSGIASTFFYSGQVSSDFEAVHIQAQVNDVKSNISTLTIAGTPEVIRPGYDTEWKLEDIDNGDGTFSLPVSALVLDTNSNAVVDGTTVYFKIEPAEGSVKSPVKTVNSIAASEITYPAASAGKVVTLTASAGGKEGEISFTLPGFTLYWMSATASRNSIPADGRSETIITATLFDRNGSSTNVPDGTTVTFTTDRGNLDPVIAMTEDGIATSVLTSDDTENAYATVTVTSGLLEDVVFVYFSEVGITDNQVSDIDLRVTEPIIPADGLTSTQVIATLYNYENEVVNSPTNVLFESDIGEITHFVRSDSLSGEATASFTSGEVGTAIITASVGSVQRSISVIVEPGEPQSVQLSFSPNSVGVQGSGRNETLQITASVKDNKNNPVGDGNLVKFELVGASDPLSSLTPYGDSPYVSEPVPTINGDAKVSFHAGTRAGTVRVKATIVDENGDPINPLITSEATQFVVYSGPAYLSMADPSDPFTDSRITLAGGPLNIFAGEVGTDNSKSTITVAVSDRYKNPVPEGTAVYLTTTGGTVTTEAFTDKDGFAHVTLYAANPFPTRNNSNLIVNPNASIGGPGTFDMPLYDFDGDGNENDGIAIVTAYTEGVDQNGDEVTVWNYVPIVFSNQVSTFTVAPDVATLYRGQSTTVRIRIHDNNGNPVMGGSSLTISSSQGNLSTNKITTTTPGRVEYQVTLINDLDPDIDEPGNTVITVNLESPNGDFVQTSTPVFMSLSTTP